MWSTIPNLNLREQSNPVETWYKLKLKYPLSTHIFEDAGLAEGEGGHKVRAVSHGQLGGHP